METGASEPADPQDFAAAFERLEAFFAGAFFFADAPRSEVSRIAAVRETGARGPR